MLGFFRCSPVPMVVCVPYGCFLYSSLAHGLTGLAVVVVLPAVEFLENRFQLGVEEAQHQLLETHGLDHHPLLLFVGGDVVHVHGGALGAGIGVGNCLPPRWTPIILSYSLGTAYFAARLLRLSMCSRRERVPLGLVGGVAALLVQVGDALEHLALGGPVRHWRYKRKRANAVLPYDRSTGVSNSAVVNFTRCASDTLPPAANCLVKYMPTTGGHGDIGVYYALK